MGNAKKFNNGENLGTVRQILNDNADEINNRVEKEEGRGLSSNDYTLVDKQKVAAAITQLPDLSGLQPKVSGKGLSTNDYTTTDRDKLAGIATNATKNTTDAQLRDRGTHTGFQDISTVTNLQTELNNRPPTVSTSPNKPTGIWYGTQAQYDAIATKVSTVEYRIYS